MADLISFREKMDKFDKESLKLFARELYIKGLSKLRKSEIIDKIAECILEPKNLFYRLATLDDRSMELLTKGSKEWAKIDSDDYKDHDLACMLNELEVADFENTTGFSTLTDVWDIYKKNIAGDEFEKYRKKASWVFKCFQWAYDMCAYVPKDVFLEMVNVKKGIHINEEELTEIYTHIPEDKKNMLLYQGSFISIVYIAHKDSLVSLLRALGDKPYYIPTEAEIEEYYIWGALISKKTYQDMKQFIITEMKLDKKKAENLLLDLWDKLFEDDDPHGTMQWFWDQFEFTSEEQVKKIVSLFMPLCNDTNLMLNRGYTPSTMPRPKMNPGQMPTIVPASSKAAKMLEEAAPKLRQMGFGVDIDGDSREIPVFGMPSGINGPMKTATRKVYPNDPCPCGSGKKYKKCCGRN
ncbi:MAG: SEC-C domain-containing protein [Butyrivibrio sp.]|nr:SEC-C domain-containing protein [Butyrivibrio sp.]